VSVFYKIMKGLCRVTVCLVYPVKMHGAENLPEGAFIMCPNHVSALDPIEIMSHVNRRVYFMAKKELFSRKLVGKMLSALGAFPIDRGNADLAAMRTCFQLLKDGKPLGIFPQGTRAKAGKEVSMHSGAALIAQRSMVPVVPVKIIGPYRKFHKLQIYIGKPLDLSAYRGRYDAETVNNVTALIEDGMNNPHM